MTLRGTFTWFEETITWYDDYCYTCSLPCKKGDKDHQDHILASEIYDNPSEDYDETLEVEDE